MNSEIHKFTKGLLDSNWESKYNFEIKFKLFKNCDLIFLKNILKDPQNTNYTLYSPDTSLEEISYRFLNKNFISELWLIILDRNMNRIGFASLTDIDFINRRCSLGHVIIKKDHRGNGFGRMNTLMLLEIAFEHLKMHSVYTYINELNIASIKIVTKSGMIRGGKLRDCALKRNDYISWVYFDILENEWNDKEENFFFKEAEIDRSVKW